MGSMLGRIDRKTDVRARHVPAADRRGTAARLAVSSAARFGTLRRLGRGGLSARRVLPGRPTLPQCRGPTTAAIKLLRILKISTDIYLLNYCQTIPCVV